MTKDKGEGCKSRSKVGEQEEEASFSIKESSTTGFGCSCLIGTESYRS
jgi:hypothetical protein